jgi:hypothetical protein
MSSQKRPATLDRILFTDDVLGTGGTLHDIMRDAVRITSARAPLLDGSEFALAPAAPQERPWPSLQSAGTRQRKRRRDERRAR